MTLGLVIADTRPDKRLARLAVERTLREVAVDDCLVVSDESFVTGARHVVVPPLVGLPGYNALMLDGLMDHLRCDSYLVIQWDGFALNGGHWTPDFLAYDYIGAPWLHDGGRVGAGGFSLRSRRLFAGVRDIRARAARSSIETPEDVQVCVVYRNRLVAAGLRFAPTEVAARFAFERVACHDGVALPTFGFHGVFNFPWIMREDDMLSLLEPIVTRMPNAWPTWHLFIWNAWRCRYATFGTALIAALARRDAQTWARVTQACLARGMPRTWWTAAA